MKSFIIVATLGMMLPMVAASNVVTESDIFSRATCVVNRELKETWHEAGQTRRRIHVTAEGTPPDDFCQYMGGVNKQCYIHESYGHVVDTSYELGLGGDQRFWSDYDYGLENWKRKTGCRPDPDECVNVQTRMRSLRRGKRNGDMVDEEDRVRPGSCLVNAEVKETWHDIRTRRRIHVTAEGADVTIFCTHMKGENKQCYMHKCYGPGYVVDISHDLGPAGDYTFWENYKQAMDLWMKETNCRTG